MISSVGRGRSTALITGKCCLGNCTCISASTAECEEEDKWTLTNVLSGSKLEEERQRRESEGRHHLTSSSQHGAGT